MQVLQQVRDQQQRAIAAMLAGEASLAMATSLSRLGHGGLKDSSFAQRPEPPVFPEPTSDSEGSGVSVSELLEHERVDGGRLIAACHRQFGVAEVLLRDELGDLAGAFHVWG
jgi:hypothetical protein